MTERHRLSAHKQPKRNIFHLSSRIPILPLPANKAIPHVYTEDTLIRSQPSRRHDTRVQGSKADNFIVSISLDRVFHPPWTVYPQFEAINRRSTGYPCNKKGGGVYVVALKKIARLRSADKSAARATDRSFLSGGHQIPTDLPI